MCKYNSVHFPRVIRKNTAVLTAVGTGSSGKTTLKEIWSIGKITVQGNHRSTWRKISPKMARETEGFRRA
jgi:hypothetical protein